MLHHNTPAGDLRPVTMSRVTRGILAVTLLTLVHGQIRAYVYPEHRRSMVISIKGLESTRRAQLDQLWTMARLGYESRLSADPADSAYSPASTTIDLGAWPAIAGDHSCSAAEMLSTATSRRVHRMLRRTATLPR